MTASPEIVFMRSKLLSYFSMRGTGVKIISVQRHLTGLKVEVSFYLFNLKDLCGFILIVCHLSIQFRYYVFLGIVFCVI